MNPIGFSVIYSKVHTTQFYASLLRDMLTAGCSAIELHTPHHDMLDDPELVDLIRVFKYRYIHSSDIHSSVENKDDLAYYEGLMGKINAMAITIHPHTMKSWGWVADHFGDLASFENMDRFKPFGGSVEDMQQIKSEYPMTRWTFDINHVYTNDSSLSCMSDFYELLGDPGHYHVSGFRDEALPHTTLYTTGQDKIIDAVATEHPIIIESLGSSDIHLFRQEYDYIVARLKG